MEIFCFIWLCLDVFLFSSLAASARAPKGDWKVPYHAESTACSNVFCFLFFLKKYVSSPSGIRKSPSFASFDCSTFKKMCLEQTVSEGNPLRWWSLDLFPTTTRWDVFSHQVGSQLIAHFNYFLWSVSLFSFFTLKVAKTRAHGKEYKVTRRPKSTLLGLSFSCQLFSSLQVYSSAPIFVISRAVSAAH